MRLHHVQVACPPGGESSARRFYADGLGLVEVDKPVELAGRGGAWFRAFDDHGAVTLELHIGVEDDFRPARKAHPAIAVPEATELDRLAGRLEQMGYVVDRSERETFPSYLRFHTQDPHGNRVEVMCGVTKITSAR